ncbi:hypothetical protein BGZ79_010809, partial [Entomortierella chlamydospora]
MEASIHQEQVIGFHLTNTQEQPNEPSLSVTSLKFKALAGWETLVKSAKHIFGMPTSPSQETTSAGPLIPKLIPDNQTTSNVEVAIYHGKTPITSGSSPARLCFNRYQVALQNYYEPYLNIQRISGDTLSLDSCYINLAIVEAPDQRQKDKENLKTQAAIFYRMRSYEEVARTNMEAPIPLKKLFDRRKLRDGREDVPKMILVQGRAGIGKTTLCKMLIHTYQQGFWNDRFDAVLWLPLRQLAKLSARNLEDILRQKYFAHHPELEREELVAALSARRDRVLFVLDGLDEIISNAKRDIGAPLESFLRHLLRQQHVVITSRPYGVDMSILPKLDLELETIGFSTRNIKDYLANVLDPVAARAVEKFIQQTPLIQDLANIPIQLDIICYCWDSLPPDLSNITMTELYQLMVTRLWRKDGVRLQKWEELGIGQINRLRPYQLDRVMAIEREYFGYLAFKGIQSHQIEFEESVLMDVMEELDQLRQRTNQDDLPLQLIDGLKQTSFFHTVDSDLDAVKDKSQCSWHFLHLAFQEYFAATWLARHLQNSPKAMMTVEETKAFIREHKYNPHYQIVWWMVAGLLQGEALITFFEVLQAAPVDLIGAYHHHLLAACLKEGRGQLGQLDIAIVASLEIQLEKWLEFEMSIYGNRNGRSILGSMSYFPQELLIRNIGQSGASRDYFIRTLGKHASLTQPAMEVLFNILQDEDSRVRETVVAALGNQLILSEPSFQALNGALQNKDVNVRRSAAIALGKQSTLHESAVLALIGALNDGNVNVRRLAVTVLGKQSTLPESALVALIDALHDGNVNFRCSAACTLAIQSTLPKSTLQALDDASKDNDKDVRFIAAGALGIQSILPEPTPLALICGLQDEDGDVRMSAAAELRTQSTLSELPLLALIGALQDENVHIRIQAAMALKKQPTLPELTLQALSNALQDEDDYVRLSVASALKKQLALPESTLLALGRALQDKNVNVRRSVADALGKQSTLPESTLL